jgi:hypothetical protein
MICTYVLEVNDFSVMSFAFFFTKSHLQKIYEVICVLCVKTGYTSMVQDGQVKILILLHNYIHCHISP